MAPDQMAGWPWRRCRSEPPGGAIMVVGFGLLALTSGIYSYLVAAAMLGLGFALCAVVPAVYLLNGWMPDNRSAVIGALRRRSACG